MTEPQPPSLPEAIVQAIETLTIIAEGVDGYRRNLIRLGFPEEQAQLLAAQALSGLQTIAFAASIERKT